MTTKKAVKIVEMLFEKKTGLKQDLAKPENNWGDGIVGGLVQTELRSLSNEIEWLKILKKEIVPNCKHPKKMRDRTPDGQWYCMNCNLDL